MKLYYVTKKSSIDKIRKEGLYSGGPGDEYVTIGEKPELCFCKKADIYKVAVLLNYGADFGVVSVESDMVSCRKIDFPLYTEYRVEGSIPVDLINMEDNFVASSEQLNLATVNVVKYYIILLGKNCDLIVKTFDPQCKVVHHSDIDKSVAVSFYCNTVYALQRLDIRAVSTDAILSCIAGVSKAGQPTYADYNSSDNKEYRPIRLYERAYLMADGDGYHEITASYKWVDKNLGDWLPEDVNKK